MRSIFKLSAAFMTIIKEWTDLDFKVIAFEFVGS